MGFDAMRFYEAEQMPDQNKPKWSQQLRLDLKREALGIFLL
jgi:hypothetical protein